MLQIANANKTSAFQGVFSQLNLSSAPQANYVAAPSVQGVAQSNISQSALTTPVLSNQVTQINTQSIIKKHGEIIVLGLVILIIYYLR